MKRVLILLVAGTAISGFAAYAASAQRARGPTLQAIECGRIENADLAPFNDTMRFRGEKRTLVAGCFLIRHPRGLLLWDTGLSDAAPVLMRRLAEGGVRPADIAFVGISHYHYDHVGGAAGFPDATLLIGKGDLDTLRARPAEDPQARALAHWLTGPGRSNAVEGDHDVFGDGSVVMLAMPGHTPGHSALLVRLPGAGPILLTGDQYHFRENRAVAGVPSFNADRADTLASHARFEEIVRVEGARVIIQHDPRDLATLPAFPAVLD